MSWSTQLLSDCVRAKYSKYMIALPYLFTYFKFSVHFVPLSHLKYVWITHSKCGSVTQLVQLKEFAYILSERSGTRPPHFSLGRIHCMEYSHCQMTNKPQWNWVILWNKTHTHLVRIVVLRLVHTVMNSIETVSPIRILGPCDRVGQTHLNVLFHIHLWS